PGGVGRSPAGWGGARRGEDCRVVSRQERFHGRSPAEALGTRACRVPPLGFTAFPEEFHGARERLPSAGGTVPTDPMEVSGPLPGAGATRGTGATTSGW
ncbi:hypothetical protein ACF1BE_33845, partial [Streptomyces sp. NPDC014991]|uniref:hypothetical protein n=1 Tax=Streptomyces sp. NPDC014991 TaxID=3364935 RepID=UPI0036FFA22F